MQNYCCSVLQIEPEKLMIGFVQNLFFEIMAKIKKEIGSELYGLYIKLFCKLSVFGLHADAVGF